MREPFARQLRAFLAPPERIGAWAWITSRWRPVYGRHARPGRYDGASTPYIRGIVETADAPAVTQVTVQKSSQTGLTEAALALVGYLASTRRRNIMVVYPNESGGAEICAERLEPGMRASAPELFTDQADDVALLRMRLRGMNIHFAWSHSETTLASRPLPTVIVDELDQCRPGTIDLAAQRTKTFPRPLVFAMSTPTRAGEGIDAQRAVADLVLDWVMPCLGCGGMDRWLFERLEWGDDHDPRPVRDPAAAQRRARMRCRSCGRAHDQHDKRAMLAGGAWARKGGPAAPFTGEPHGHVHFELPGEASPFPGETWGLLARSWCEAGGRPPDSWWNHRLGRVRPDEAREAEVRGLRAAAAASEWSMGQLPPMPVCAVTAGVDVQGDRCHVTILGFAARAARWALLWHGVVASHAMEGFAALSDLIRDGRAPPAGYGGAALPPLPPLPVQAWAIDSGHWTRDVYQLCRRLDRSASLRVSRWPAVVPVKGDHQGRTPTRATTVGRGVPTEEGALVLVHVPTYAQIAADDLASLSRAGLAEPRALLPRDVEDQWLAQTTAERRVAARDKRGRPVALWELPAGAENHDGDALRYALAIAGHMSAHLATTPLQPTTTPTIPTTPTTPNPAERPRLRGLAAEVIRGRGAG